jgi:hypothetical protein
VDARLSDPAQPPDPNQPWVFIDGRWWLIAMDSTDDVPDDLSYVDTPKETNHDPH